MIQRLMMMGVMLATLANVTSLHAQESQRIHFDHFGIPGSIRSAFVSDIIQDEEGLLWLATSAGLYRYNGKQFTPIPFVAADSSRLTGREILTLLWDKVQHRLLVGTAKHGLLSYRYQDDSLQVVTPSAVPIDRLVQTRDGQVYALHQNSHLSRLEDRLLRPLKIPTLFTPSALLAHENALIIGERQRIVVWQGKVVQTLPMAWRDKVFAETARFCSLTIDHLGRLWGGTERDGVWVYNLSEGTPIDYISNESSPYFSRINRLQEDQQGRMWILTRGEGLAIYNPITRTSLLLRRDYTNPYSLSGNSCSAVLRDNTGIMWVGTNGSLNKHDPAQFKFEHYRHDPYNPASLSDNMVRGIYVDHQDVIWAGTDAGYINTIDPATQTVTKIKVALAHRPGLVIVPLAFAEKDDDEMFVGTSTGLLVYHRKQQRFSPYTPLQKQIQERRVRQLIRHHESLYCLVSGSVVVVNLNTGEQKTYTKFNEATANAFNASYIFIDHQGALWVATLNGYVGQLETQHQQFKSHQLSRDSARLMILSLTEQGQQLYASTLTAGVFVMTRQADGTLRTTQHFTEKNGLADNTVYVTMPDDAGNLWLSSNLGISRYSTRDSLFTHFGTAEGVQEEEFNRLAFGRTSQGHLVFGGINGINIFDPQRVSANLTPIIPKLFGVSAYTTSINDRNYDYYNLIGRTQLKLKHDQNFFSIDFGTVDYHTPVRHRYVYKLENFDQQWIEAGQRNFASYTGLPPGDYTFRLRATSPSGELKEAAFQLSIVPPFYKTWWFNILAFVAAGVIVVGIIQGRIQQDKLDKQRLELLLKERTQEIEKSREELQTLNQKKDLIFSILSHDLRSPLTTLKGFLGMLIEDVDQLPREDIRKHAMTIRNSVTNSLDLIDNTLFWSLSQMGNITHNPTRLSINALLEKVRGLYQLTAEKKRIHFTVEALGDLYIQGDENMVYVTLRNLTSNALKFTPPGKSIHIRAHAENHQVIIQFVDEGIGMSHDYVQKIMSTEQPMLKKGTSNEKGTGLGLLLCKSFIEQNQGTLTVNSTEHHGTTFTVTFPADVAPATAIP